MFAFAPVGGVVALVGVAFVTLLGWRLLPKDRRAAPDPEKLFDIAHYVTELRVPDESALAGSTIADLESLTDADVRLLGIVRGERRRLVPRPYERIEGGDVLVVEADAAAIKAVVSASDLTLEEAAPIRRDDLRNDEVVLSEVIVPPSSRLQGRSATSLRLRTLHGVNLLAIARHGVQVKRRLSAIRLDPGDVLLLQGPSARVADAIGELGLLPLVERNVTVSKPRRLALSASVFALAIAAVVVGLLPVHVAFATAAVVLTLVGVLGRDEPYAAIDWPVIVLLGAMIPVATALEATGGTALIAGWVFAATGGLGPVWVLVTLMVVTMMISDVVNNNATAVLMAPLAIDLAARLDVSVDPLLMAVAIGASCAFLTPIGHQSNTLVLKPGGYRFGDYWRMGLPLEIVIVVVSVPLILVVWPW